MRNNDTLDPLVTALKVLRNIYNAADVNQFGDIVIRNASYTAFFKDIQNEIGKLERVISSCAGEK